MSFAVVCGCAGFFAAGADAAGFFAAGFFAVGAGAADSALSVMNESRRL